MITRQEEALLEATATGNHRVVHQLITNGCQVNTQHPMNLYTPLHWAIKRKNPIMVRLLLEHGADIRLQNSSSVSPLDMALGECWDDEVIKVLEEMKVEFERPTRKEDTIPEKKFVPNYLRAPDLSKAWGEATEFVQADLPILPPSSSTTTPTSYPTTSITREKESSDDDKLLEIIVYANVARAIELPKSTSKDHPCPFILGAVFIQPHESIQTLLDRIFEELFENIKRDIRYIRYTGEVGIPIHKSQYSQKVGTHFKSGQGIIIAIDIKV